MTILETAADLLRLYGLDCTELTVSEVTARLNIPKANASRLMKAMRDAGILETIGASKRHRPGRLLLNVAAAYRKSSGIIVRAGEVVENISRTFGHTGYITQREGLEVISVADFQGTNALRVVSSAGRRMPAAHTATGRCLLARMSDAEVLALYPDPAVSSPLLERLARVRDVAFGYSARENTPGVDALAVAVIDPATHEAISLCMVYPHALVEDDERNRMLTALAEGAAEIAREFGDDGFVVPQIHQKGFCV